MARPRAAPFPQDFDQEPTEQGGLPAPAAIPEYEPALPLSPNSGSFLDALTAPRGPAPADVEDEGPLEPEVPREIGVPSFMARPNPLNAPSLIRPYDDDRSPTPKPVAPLLSGATRPDVDERDFDRPDERPRLPYTPRKTAAPISRVSRNNSIIPGERFDLAKWQPVDWPKDDNSIVAGDKIAVHVKSEALLPTNQFRFLVTAIPLDEKGNPQPSLATNRWFDPVNYATATGTFFDRTLIIGATSSAPRHRWIVSIPPQQAAHDNAAHNSLQVFVPRE